MKNMGAYKFVEIKDDAGRIAYMNPKYIVCYRYDQQMNETLIDILGEDGTRHLPGDQTQEIAHTINYF